MVKRTSLDKESSKLEIYVEAKEVSKENLAKLESYAERMNAKLIACTDFESITHSVQHLVRGETLMDKIKRIIAGGS